MKVKKAFLIVKGIQSENFITIPLKPEQIILMEDKE